MEFRDELIHKRSAISAALDRIKDEDYAARIKGEPGREAEERKALITGLTDDPAWKVSEFSATIPYQRMLDIGKLYDFTQPGEYRVQLLYDNSRWFGDREERKGPWVGTVSSPVLTVTIKPRG